MRRNGWSEAEIKKLEERTGKSRPLVEAFCDAVDKKLFLLLDERGGVEDRATVHLGTLPCQRSDELA